ncbi:hypothetical protein ACIP9H_33385 [Streptomyces sp. NPDC088732]|uniref:hypothetical protein n=1 Tax=Streptomyces sp. NPDC088732 TaxID=3365879 RepID=UPI0037FA3E63
MTVVAEALKPLPALHAQFGPPRVILSATGRTDIMPEQIEAFRFNLLAGKTLRESVINGTDGTPDLIIRCASYIDPVTRVVRYAVDYWSVLDYYAIDTTVRAVSEAMYEGVVRGEFAAPTLRLDLGRFTRGLASFYDVTDVI